jgi:hypothetical protein
MQLGIRTISIGTSPFSPPAVTLPGFCRIPVGLGPPPERRVPPFPSRECDLMNWVMLAGAVAGAVAVPGLF